jgi:predicted amidohydrolase YtcJ
VRSRRQRIIPRSVGASLTLSVAAGLVNVAPFCWIPTLQNPCRRDGRRRLPHVLALAGLFAALTLTAPSSAPAVGRIVESADAIFFNGKILTVDRDFSVQQAFAVRGESFLSVGSDVSIQRAAGPNTRMVNLRGATVVPGMSDNHDHLFAVERTERGLDLIDCESKQDVLRSLSDRLRAVKPGEVVYGRIAWQLPLTRGNLDDISAGRPIVLMRLRRGQALLDTAALRLLGITRDNPRYRGQLLPVDLSGEPTGEISSWPAGLLAVDALIPPSTPLESQEMVVRGQRARNALGITSIRDLSNLPDWARVYWRMRRDGKLTLRISMGLSLPNWEDPLVFLREQTAGPGFGDHWLRLDSVGEDLLPLPANTKDFIPFVREVNRLGWRLSPHVANDSIETVLAAYEAADKDASIHSRRWIVEHANGLTEAQMDRLGKLGVIVSVQSYGALLGPLSRYETNRMWPVRDLVKHGITVISGSDTIGRAAGSKSPSNNPFDIIYFYVTGKRDGIAVAPDQTVSRAEALRFTTINSAFATYEEDVKGSIEAGKLADFVILSGNYLTVADEDLLTLRPLATYVGGKKVYAALGAEAAL